MIGSLGNVVFETSAEKIRTFHGLKRSGSGRWATHEVLGQKPVLEYVGPDIEQISLTIRLDAALGVNPAEELSMLREMRDKGEAVNFILDGQPVTEDTLWAVESLSEEWQYIDNVGRVLVATVEVTLREYVPSEVQAKWNST